MDTDYKPGSLTLLDAVAMGTGVMIGAGIFALTGQIAEFAGPLFPLAFVAAAVISGFSAYSYIKMSNAYPSAGGIAMILEKAYGPGLMTGACALLMAFSMVINESLVARTFGTYLGQVFDFGARSAFVPAAGVGLIAFAFIVNLTGNRAVGGLSIMMAVAKISGVALLAIVGLALSGASYEAATPAAGPAPSAGGFLAATALGILAYKGFTTITNSGAEIRSPHHNVGRAIMIALAVCTVVYLLVTTAVAANLPLPEIIAAKDYALAEAARPAFGRNGVWITVFIAIVATASGLLASVFAVSRMLAMLTEMHLIPHRHFGMPGRIQKHMLVFTVVAATVLTVFFDLSRIAALGAIFYLVMDIAVHWGVFRHARRDVGASPAILLTAIMLDAVVLAAFAIMKLRSDPLIIFISVVGVAVAFAFESWFLRRRDRAAARGYDAR